MAYRSLRQCVLDLERNGHLVRIREEVDPYLEMAEIQRRLYAAQGPAVLFERVKGSPFPAVCNLYGTEERTKFIFRHTLEGVKAVVRLKADPASALRNPLSALKAVPAAFCTLPLPALRKSVMYGQTTLDQLPLIHSWPMDGGPYVLLPQVYTEHPDQPGVLHANMGMYRVQLMGNDYVPNREIGLHYQIHRGIGIHHTAAARKGEKLRVSIFVGGPPAHAFSAVMPLPENLSETMFAGMLAGRNFRYTHANGHTLSADADFCIVGTIDPTATKPEGPFGDHLGYYSLAHDFPVMQVEAVYYRKGAIWPFTAVGRPPQEDTTFGALIHEIAGPMAPVSVPGLVEMHAVDAAGVHPLLLAIGQERYMPYRKREPQEILTVANAILGFNQASLAKYLFMAAHQDTPPDIHAIEAFFSHILTRADWRRDLHFYTRTTIDTLDYSGTGLNQGSKLVVAAAGEPVRRLATEVPEGLSLPPGFSQPHLAMPGVLCLTAPAFADPVSGEARAAAFCEEMRFPVHETGEIALVVLCDDSAFAARSLNNWLWVTFTRSNPSHDVYGVGSFTDHKHWGCTGPLVIDARIKPHHAPPLVEDPEVSKRVETRFGRYFSSF